MRKKIFAIIDIISIIGRIVTMVSSIFGIAIVALSAGIITAGYMSKIEKE